MLKRSGKFYRNNEKEVMKSLGLEPTYNSGSGWIEKEDGSNDYVLCQLKSTDAQGIKVNQKDIRILEKNAAVEHKYPLFAIQFLNTNEVWLMIKPEDVCEIAKYIETGKVDRVPTTFIDVDPEKDYEEMMVQPSRYVGNSYNARLAFENERKKKYDKTRSAK